MRTWKKNLQFLDTVFYKRYIVAIYKQARSVKRVITE